MTLLLPPNATIGLVGGGQLGRMSAMAAAQRPITELRLVSSLSIGKLSSWVEVTSSAVWVASEQPNAIHRIDPKQNKQVADITLPHDPCAGLAAGLGTFGSHYAARGRASLRSICGQIRSSPSF